MSATKVLRACIVEQGKVIEERRLADRETLSIGTTPKNTFVLADGAAPKAHQLFIHKGGHYELVLADGMTSKISVGDNVLDMEALKSQGLLKQDGHVYRLRLTDNNRGKVHVGPYTLIFQFVAPTPVPEKPTLPPELKANYLKNLDVMYSTIFGCVVLITMSLLVYFRYVPAPAEVTFDTMDERFAQLIVPDYKPEEVKPEPTKAKTDEGKAKQKAEDKPKEDVDDSDPKEVAKAKAARTEKIREKIAGRGVLAILGAKGSGSGAVADVFGDSNIGGDLDSAFEGISGVGVASGSGRTTRGSGSGEAASIGGLATAGGGQVGLGGKKEARVAGVKAENPEVDGQIDSNAVADYVRKRIRSIQDCYERELKRDASLQGKIEVEFTIGSSGEVEDARVSSNRMGSDAVGDCILSRVRRWKFPAPDGGSVTVNYPFIFTPSS